jgi:hypothetical protein
LIELNLGLSLSVASGVLQLLSFFLYNRKVLRGQSHPNAATWSLWVGLTVLNCVTYVMMTTDLVKGIMPMVSTLACFVTFWLALVRGKFSRLSSADWGAMFCGALACLVWWVYHSVTGANLILQVCVLISFVPTYRSVWNLPGQESPVPWFGWGAGYALAVGLVLLRWQGHYQDFVYPLSGCLLHSGLGVIALRKARVPRTLGHREASAASGVSVWSWGQ